MTMTMTSQIIDLDHVKLLCSACYSCAFSGLWILFSNGPAAPSWATAARSSCGQYTYLHDFEMSFGAYEICQPQERCLNFKGRQSINCKTELLHVACEGKHCVLAHCIPQLVTAPFSADGCFISVIFALFPSYYPELDGIGPSHELRETWELLSKSWFVQQKGKRSLVTLCLPTLPFNAVVIYKFLLIYFP